MLTVTGSRSMRLMLGISALLCLVCAVVLPPAMVEAQARNHTSAISLFVIIAPLVLGFFSAASACVHGYRLSLARYSMSAGVLQIYDRRGHRSVALNTVAEYHTSPHGSITLVDTTGRKLKFVTELAYDPDGRFRTALLNELRHVRERQLQAMFQAPRAFSPGRMKAAGLTIPALFFGCLALAAMFDRSPDMATTADRLPFVGLLTGMALACAIAANWQLRASLTIGADGLTFSSPWRSISILLSDLESVSTRVIRRSCAASTITTVKSAAGQKLTLGELMEDADLAREFLERNGPVEAVDAGQAIQREHDIRLKRRAPYVTGVLLSVLVVFGIGFIVAANRRLGAEVRLDRDGVPATATVERRYEAGLKETHYMVAYRFPVGLREFEGRSELGRTDYDRLAVGQRIPVTYLPHDPGISRADSSISRLTGRGMLATGLLNLALACVLLLCGWYSARRKRSASLSNSRADSQELTVSSS